MGDSSGIMANVRALARDWTPIERNFTVPFAGRHIELSLEAGFKRADPKKSNGRLLVFLPGENRSPQEAQLVLSYAHFFGFGVAYFCLKGPVRFDAASKSKRLLPFEHLSEFVGALNEAYRQMINGVSFDNFYSDKVVLMGHSLGGSMVAGLMATQEYRGQEIHQKPRQNLIRNLMAGVAIAANVAGQSAPQNFANRRYWQRQEVGRASQALKQLVDRFQADDSSQPLSEITVSWYRDRQMIQLARRFNHDPHMAQVAAYLLRSINKPLITIQSISDPVISHPKALKQLREHNPVHGLQFLAHAQFKATPKTNHDLTFAHPKGIAAFTHVAISQVEMNDWHPYKILSSANLAPSGIPGLSIYAGGSPLLAFSPLK